MEIIDYDKVELVFEGFSIVLPRKTIEEFKIDKVEQFVESKYNTRDEYNVCLVIDEATGEKVWKKEIPKKFKGISNEDTLEHLVNPNGLPYYNSLAECINSQNIYEINIYKKNHKVENCLPVWTYTNFDNEYQKIGITDDKIMIRIVEI